MAASVDNMNVALGSQPQFMDMFRTLAQMTKNKHGARVQVQRKARSSSQVTLKIIPPRLRSSTRSTAKNAATGVPKASASGTATHHSSSTKLTAPKAYRQVGRSTGMTMSTRGRTNAKANGGNVVTQATSAMTATRKKRRVITELGFHEKWFCPRGCGKAYRRTSTKSIQSHNMVCPFITLPKDSNPDQNNGQTQSQVQAQSLPSLQAALSASGSASSTSMADGSAVAALSISLDTTSSEHKQNEGTGSPPLTLISPPSTAGVSDIVAEAFADGGLAPLPLSASASSTLESFSPISSHHHLDLRPHPDSQLENVEKNDCHGAAQQLVRPNSPIPPEMEEESSLSSMSDLKSTMQQSQGRRLGTGSGQASSAKPQSQRKIGVRRRWFSLQKLKLCAKACPKLARCKVIFSSETKRTNRTINLNVNTKLTSTNIAKPSRGARGTTGRIMDGSGAASSRFSPSMIKKLRKRLRDAKLNKSSRVRSKAQVQKLLRRLVCITQQLEKSTDHQDKKTVEAITKELQELVHEQGFTPGDSKGQRVMENLMKPPCRKRSRLMKALGRSQAPIKTKMDAFLSFSPECSHPDTAERDSLASALDSLPGSAMMTGGRGKKRRLNAPMSAPVIKVPELSIGPTGKIVIHKPDTMFRVNRVNCLNLFPEPQPLTSMFSPPFTSPPCSSGALFSIIGSPQGLGSSMSPLKALSLDMHTPKFDEIYSQLQ